MMVCDQGGGRRGRQKMVQQRPLISSPLKLLGPEAPLANDDLGDPLSDEEEEPPVNNHLSPVSTALETACISPTNADAVIKSEPVDDDGAGHLDPKTGHLYPKTGHLDPKTDAPLPYQLMEHSYSYPEVIYHVGGGYHTGHTIEEGPLSRTSGRRQSAAGNLDEGDQNLRVNVVVQLRKRQAPPITNRLIIPIVRVPRSTLVDRNMMEKENTVIGAVEPSDICGDRRIISNGEVYCCILETLSLCLSLLSVCFNSHF